MPRMGSIPACAGEPQGIERQSALGGVYPRVCGGTCAVSSVLPPWAGLSPRVRGNHPLGARTRLEQGSIPACAGEPPLALGAQHLPRVYPRVCGGTGKAWANSATTAGLSPRVRGNPVPIAKKELGNGSIPACAGEPRPGCRRCPRTGVYPRVCGGTAALIPEGMSIEGLSPRVRGNQGQEDPGAGGRGSIPACAGEPWGASESWIPPWVYPRVCGGTLGHELRPRHCHGLSPRVRGNRPPNEHTNIGGGSIPACAGEPRRPGRRAGARRVYPRVCGGTTASASRSASGTGLSPRVRGNRALGRS